MRTWISTQRQEHLPARDHCCVYSVRRWEQERFSGADRHYTADVCFSGADRLLPCLIIVLGLGLVLCVSAFVFCILLKNEICREGIPFFEVAALLTVMVFIFFHGPIREIGLDRSK